MVNALRDCALKSDHFQDELRKIYSIKIRLLWDSNPESCYGAKRCIKSTTAQRLQSSERAPMLGASAAYILVGGGTTRRRRYFRRSVPA